MIDFLDEYLGDLVIQALSMKYSKNTVFHVNILSQNWQSRILNIIASVSFGDDQTHEFTIKVKFTDTGYKFIGVKNNDNSDPN